jgi:hypothetical protein
MFYAYRQSTGRGREIKPIEQSCFASQADHIWRIVICERAKFEEQFLKANLPGYVQYAKTVPSRPVSFQELIDVRSPQKASPKHT